MWQYQKTNELYHWGVPGMKWGIRRYQNKDGSLTPKGRKRASQILDKYEKVTGKRIKIIDSNDNAKSKNKSVKPISDMTIDELKNKTTRFRAEADYIKAYNDLKKLDPKTPVNKVGNNTKGNGKKFVTYVGSNVIKPAATEAGKKVVEAWLTKAFNNVVNNKSAKKAKKATKQIATTVTEAAKKASK